jgi:hypothetical protein
LLGVSPTLLPTPLFWLAALANMGAALLLGIHGAHLWRKRAALPELSWVAGGGLSIVLMTAVLLLWPGVWREYAGGQMRIFYLHVLLLMWVSTALFGVLVARWAPNHRSMPWRELLWIAGVLVMIVALLGVGLAPQLGLPQLPWLLAAAWGSLGVAIGASLFWLDLIRDPATAPQKSLYASD